MMTKNCVSSAFTNLSFFPYTFFWLFLYQEQTMKDIIAPKYLQAAPKKKISHSPGQGWTRQEITALNCSKRESS